MYLDYGRLLRAGGQHAEAVAALRVATQIDPNDREARLELGYAYLTDGKHAEALAQLQMVKRVTAEQAYAYFHAMTYAYYRLDKEAEAHAAADTCRKYAKTPDEIERLDQLVDALDGIPHVPGISAAAPAEGADPPAPRLRRREALAVAEGTLKQIDCMDGKIRMRIGVGAEAMSFAILNPASVTVKDGAPMDFTCGPQSARRIRIEDRIRPILETFEV